MSDSSRHTPRKWARPRAGEWSAPRVITMPEPRPLPKPTSSEASRKGITDAVKGIVSSATPMIAMHGTATQLRPLVSISLPAG